MSTNRIQVQIQAIDDASAQIQKVRDSLTGLGNSGKGLVNISGMLSGIASSAMGFISAQVAMAGFSNSINLVKEAFIDFNATMETSRKSFENMLGSKDAAAVFINDLQAFAEATPFDFPELQQASKMMLGLGWAAKDILPALEAVGNAAANAGLSGGEISNIVMSISQMRGAGKIDAQNLKELDRRGVGATKILQDAYGMSIEEIQKSGKDINEVVDTLVKGMNEKFKGAMETQQGTFTQMLSNVQDQMSTILGEIGKPFFEVAKTGLKAVGDITANLATTIREGGMAKVFEEMIPPEWQEKIKLTFDVIDQLIKSWTPSFLMLAESVKLTFELLGNALLSPVVIASFNILNEVVVGLAETFLALYNTSISLANEGWKELNKSTGDMAAAFSEAGKAIYDAVSESISDTVNFIYENLSAAWDYIQEGWSECLQETRASLNPLGQAVFDAFEGVYNTIRDIMDEVIKMVAEKMQAVVETILSYFGIINDLAKSIAGLSDMFQPRDDFAKGPGDVAKREDGTVVIGGTEKIKANVMPGININASYLPPADFKTEQSLFQKVQELVTKRFDEIKGKNDIALSDAKLNANAFKGSGASGGGGKSRGGEDEDPTGEIAAKLLETQEQAFRELKNESALISAKLIGDRQAQAEAEFRIEVEKLAKQREEKLKDVTDKIAIEKWYNDQIALLEKERDEKQRDFKSEEFDNLIEFNQLEVDLRLKSQEEVNRINRDVFDKKIAFLKEELANENLTVEQIIELRKQLADVQQQKSNSPINTSEAFGAGLQQEADTWGDFFTNIKTVGQETARAMRDSFQEFFFDAMTGQLKSLGDYINSFLKGVARAISNALANAFAQKLIGSLFGNILPGKADGGPVYSGAPYIVGERGPELFVPSASGTIVPNHALKSASNSAPTVIVNVQNNLGVKAEVKQETKFDGQRFIVGVVLDAYTRNIGGMRTVMAGARG